jgi:hypothetical protein
MPPLHVWPALQTLPQTPQLALSLSSFVQWSPQAE